MSNRLPSLGKIPGLRIDEIEADINLLETRLNGQDPEQEDSPEARRVLEILLRNRRNLKECLNAGRFI